MLNDAQKETIREWAASGAELAEIHRRIAEELGVRMTYLEARLLVSELEVKLDRPEEETDATADPEAESDQGPDPGIGKDGDEDDESLDKAWDDDPATSGVSVNVDQITQPQAMVSGRVTFSDGKGGGWYVDRMGRLGIDPDEEGYRPSESDITAFQQKLQATLRDKGF
jgi:hypothetical protein